MKQGQIAVKNTMFRIAICDDELVYLDIERQIIKEYLDSIGIEFLVDCFSSGTDLLRDATNKNYDIIMLDVEMPDLDGIEVARRLRERGVLSPISFVSAHMNYSTYGYHVSAVRFILKNDDIRVYIVECLEHILKSIDLNNRIIEIEFSFGNRQIRVNDILYLKSRGNYTLFIMENNEKNEQFQQKSPIKTVTQKLSYCDFISVSSSVSVNLHHVVAVSRYDVLLDCGEHLTVSQKKFNDVQKAFMLYSRGKDL